MRAQLETIEDVYKDQSKQLQEHFLVKNREFQAGNNYEKNKELEEIRIAYQVKIEKLELDIKNYKTIDAKSDRKKVERMLKEIENLNFHLSRLKDDNKSLNDQVISLQE